MNRIYLYIRDHYFVILVFSFIVFLICQFLKFGYSPDDTYIYLQYARNIAAGNGISFNGGEPSYGITSPLWALMLTIPYLINLNGFWFAKSLDVFFAILSILIFYKLSRIILINRLHNEDLLHKLQIVSTSFFTLNVWFIRWAFTGMETSLAVFGVICVFYFYLKERYIIAFTVLGFYYLIRPESIVLFIVFTLFLLINRVSVRKVIKYVFFYLIILFTFLVFAKLYFGTFVPNTAIGKTSLNFGFSTYFGQLKVIFGSISASSVIELILSMFLIIYYLLKEKCNKVDFLILSWFAGLISLYLVTDSDIISRYLLIIIPFISFFSVQVIIIMKRSQLLFGLILFVIILFQSQFVFFNSVKPHTDNFERGMTECFIYIGKWLSDNTPANSKIILGDVGTIGYYSNRYVIDAGALINQDLKLNEVIISTPLKERERMTNVLKFTSADYLVQRDTIPMSLESQEPDKSDLKFLFSREFPGLGISDPRIIYYSVYKIRNIN